MVSTNCFWTDNCFPSVVISVTSQLKHKPPDTISVLSASYQLSRCMLIHMKPNLRDSTQNYVSNLIWIIKGKENLLPPVQISSKREAPFLYILKCNKGAFIRWGAQIYNHCNIVLLPQEMYILIMLPCFLFCIQVQIRPWSLSDSDFVMDGSQPLDPRKTIFVGGVPRPLRAGTCTYQ